MDSARSRGGRTPMGRAFGRSAMARTLAYFYFAGGSLGYLSLLLPHPTQTGLDALAVLCGLAYGAGFLLVSVGSRLPRSAIPAFLAGGTVLITAAVYFDGHESSVYALFYVWVGIEAFYFLPRWQAALQLVLVAAAYAWALTTTGADGELLQRWLLTVGTALVASLLVMYMRERIESLMNGLSDAARTDPLTGLLNRRAFEELFEVELERARRSSRSLSVLVADLDGFKQVNDRLGHQAGDNALQALAEDIAKWKRRIDVAARIGGEEFALLLPETSERGALLVAERLRRAVRLTFAKEDVPLTISFGVATFPDHAGVPELLLRAADQALYAAKELGRDRTVIYSLEVAKMLAAGGPSAIAGGEMQLATVLGLAEALDIRDTGTARHSRTVGRYAAMMAEELGFEAEHVERVRLAGVLHDVGKIGISNDVLTKPGPLSEDEWREVRTHPQIGARLLAGPDFDDLRSWIAAHHERPDSGGYPAGLPADEIPLEARVLAVADAYEAMTADRVYRPALGDEAARQELVSGAGSQFDPDVVAALLRGLDRRVDRAAPTVTK